MTFQISVQLEACGRISRGHDEVAADLEKSHLEPTRCISKMRLVGLAKDDEGREKSAEFWNVRHVIIIKQRAPHPFIMQLQTPAPVSPATC